MRRRYSLLSRSAAQLMALQIAFAALFAVLSWSSDAHAYAWMIRHDYTACGACHADPSGGELLTQYGRVTSDLVLRTQYGGGAEDSEDEEESSGEFEGPKTGVFWGALDLPDSLLLSGSYRNLYILQPSEEKKFTLIPVMQGDLYGRLKLGPVSLGGSVGIARVPEGSPHARAAQVVGPQEEGMFMISRTHYAGVDIGDKVIVRAGRLNLPFGVRVPEHTMWVRTATRTDRESDQQHGVAMSYVSDSLRMEIMGIAGNFQTRLEPGGAGTPYEGFKGSDIHERGYSMFIEGIAGTNFATGVSSKVTYARLDRLNFRENALRQAHGLTARWAPAHQFSVLAETNILFRSEANTGYVGFAQADYEPIQGLHLMLTGEFIDEGLPVQAQGEATPIASPGLGLPKAGGWVSLDWFFYKQLEFRTDLIKRYQEPLTLMGQLHFYL